VLEASAIFCPIPRPAFTVKLGEVVPIGVAAWDVVAFRMLIPNTDKEIINDFAIILKNLFSNLYSLSTITTPLRVYVLPT
jgi:hypothetical protein